MRVVIFCLASLALAQDPQWRRDLMGLSDHPVGATAQDVDRFVRNVQMATPYFATITPGDFEANREMFRRMWAYTMALEMMSKQNPGLRPLASRARNAMNAFPIGYMMIQPGGGPQNQAPQQEAPPAKAGAAPFAMSAPNVEGAPGELIDRYGSTAARAAVVWQNAETLRLSLVSRGMTMNAQTASSVNRLKLALDGAVRSMQGRNWDEANASLDRADGEIEKIAKVVGH